MPAIINNDCYNLITVKFYYTFLRLLSISVLLIILISSNFNVSSSDSFEDHIIFSTITEYGAVKDITVDSQGNSYIVGNTGFGISSDIFITKLDKVGNWVFTKIIGGSNEDYGTDIVVDDNRNSYILGTTRSIDFPTNNSIQATFKGDLIDLFVLRLDEDGNNVAFSTYLGGSSWEHPGGIAIDNQSNVHITGFTTSLDFPLKNPLRSENSGDGQQGEGVRDAFVTRISSNGTLLYSSYLGGSRDDEGNDIATDNMGNSYIIGRTFSSDFPTKNPFQSSKNAFTNIFITKINVDGSELVFSTFFGADDAVVERALGIAVDKGSNIYLTGHIEGKNFPVKNAIESSSIGVEDIFVTKFNSDGQTLNFSTYFGGTKYDSANDIAVDDYQNVYITGKTFSADFPSYNNSLHSIIDENNRIDSFVVIMRWNGSLVYSSRLGGSQTDEGFGIAVDNNQSILISGFTSSSDFPILNPYTSLDKITGNGFVTKFSEYNSIPPRYSEAWFKTTPTQTINSQNVSTQTVSIQETLDSSDTLVNITSSKSTLESEIVVLPFNFKAFTSTLGLLIIYLYHKRK